MHHKNQIKFAISICLSLSSFAIHAEGYINENMIVFTSSMDLDESPWKDHPKCIPVLQNGESPKTWAVQYTYLDHTPITLICAELAGDFHLGYARQLTDKSSLLFDLAF